MADLKTTNIYGDAYINNKVGINTNTPATRLQIGQLSPTAATEGIQFGDDTSTRIYRGAAGQINFNGTINVLGNTYLGDGNNDTVFVNDTIRIGATDSGDASLFFGEGAVAGSDYGARWYWDSGYTFTWYTRNAGTDTALFDYVTNDLNYINWRRHFHMQNKEINYNAQVHFNAGTRFVGNSTEYLIFRSDSNGVGGIQVQSGDTTLKGYIGYWDSGGGGILNNTGNWSVRYNFGNANSGGTLYGAWTVNGNISATNLSGTNTGDQTVGNGTITIAAGTGIGVGTSNTFTTNQTGNSTVTVTNNGVTSNVAGTGITVSGATGAVTITNSGVTSLTGTANRVTVSAATGAVTLNLPQDIHTGASPTFSELTLSGTGIGAYGFMKYGGTRSGDWQLFTTSSAGAGQMNVVQVENIGGGGHSNYPTGVYTYGGVMSWRLPNHSFQLYAAHTGDLAYKTQWNNDNYSGWRRILDSTNYPYAANMNQYVRTTDNPTFGTVTAALSGNATTATTLQTARNINGVSFNGSAAITVNGLNYNVNNDWLRENGDDDQFKLYGNSRTMIYRTDGNTNAHGGGAYAHIFYYGGSADANRMFIINTDGRLWSTYHGWLDTMSISGNAATATSADNIDGRPFVNTNSNSATNADTINSNGISYYTGGVTNFSGNATDGALFSQAYSNDWQHQIAGDYRSGQIALRGKNSGTWQSWRRVLDETNAAYAWNMNQYVRTTDNVTFGTVTATLSGTATNAGAINSDTGNVGGSRLQYWQTSGNTALNPDGEWYNAIRMGHGDPVTYYSNTLAVRMTGGNLGDIYTRTTTNGVTGSWNRFWHNNNDGVGSGLDADLLDGLAMHTGRNNEANKVVRTDSNGYIQAGWINTTSGDMPDTESINKIYCSGDDYVRYKGVADFKQQIGLTFKNSTPRSTSTTDTNYWTGVMGWGTTDWNTMFDWGSGFTDSWSSPANKPTDSTHHVGLQVVHYTNGSGRYGWQMANGGGTGRWWLRDVWGGNFNAWFEILTSTNYTNYAPSLTGTGASGNWAINITGNAATATTATNVTIANGSVTLAKIENITAYTILGNSNASAAATPAALSVATVATMLSGQTMNINGSSTSISGFGNPTTAASGNTIAYRDGNGDLSTRYFFGSYHNSTDDISTSNITYIMAKFGDNYHRSATAAKVAAFITGQTMNINGSSTSCSGNAATATNVAASGITGQTGMWTSAARPGPYRLYRNDHDSAYNLQLTWQAHRTNYWSLRGYLNDTFHAECFVVYSGYADEAGALTIGNTYRVANLGINVAASNKLHINGDGTTPTIRIDNGALVTGVASNSKNTFQGYLPVSFGGTTYYIRLWT